jgi:hypothetical protein
VGRRLTPDLTDLNGQRDGETVPRRAELIARMVMAGPDGLTGAFTDDRGQDFVVTGRS